MAVIQVRHTRRLSTFNMKVAARSSFKSDGSEEPIIVAANDEDEAEALE